MLDFMENSLGFILGVVLVVTIGFCVYAVIEYFIHKPLDPCVSVNISTGDLQIKNIQCLKSPDKKVDNNVALVTFMDKSTEEEKTYTVTNVDDRLIYDLSSQNMLSIKKSKDREEEGLAIGIATGIAIRSTAR